MARLLLCTLALLTLAACDSAGTPSRLDGAWVSRDSVIILGAGNTVLRGTSESEYTFAVDGRRVSGTQVTTTRDGQRNVVNQTRSRITGTFTDPTLTLTLDNIDSDFSIDLTGTVSATEIRLLIPDDGPDVPYGVLRRP